MAPETTIFERIADAGQRAASAIGDLASQIPGAVETMSGRVYSDNPNVVTQNSVQGAQLLRIIPLHLPQVGQIVFVPYNLKLAQTFSPNYEKQVVYGKMDPIVTFKNVGRQLTFSFDLFPLEEFSPASSTNLADTVNLFAASLYPSYTAPTGQNILKAPPFFRIQFGDIVGAWGHDAAPGPDGSMGLTGLIEGVQISMGDVSQNWTESMGKITHPLQYQVSFSFTAVHTKPPGWYHSQQKIFGGGANFVVNTGINTNSSAHRSRDRIPGVPNSATDTQGFDTGFGFGAVNNGNGSENAGAAANAVPAAEEQQPTAMSLVERSRRDNVLNTNRLSLGVSLDR